jgi:hypothetical protein
MDNDSPGTEPLVTAEHTSPVRNDAAPKKYPNSTEDGNQTSESTATPEIFVALENPGACLDGLPDELIVEIFSHLSKDDLQQVFRANRHYKRIAYSFVYRVVKDLDDRKKLRSIANHPGLAKHIQTICAMPFRNYMDWANELAQVLQNAIHIRLLNVSVCRGDSLPAQRILWLKPFRATNPVTLIQASHGLTNLRCMRIDIDVLPEDSMQFIFRLPSLITLNLSHLSERTSFMH